MIVVNEGVRFDEVFATPLTEEERTNADLEAKQQEAQSYLRDTAWYVERLNDPSSGKEIPQEVLDKRAEAREIINEVLQIPIVVEAPNVEEIAVEEEIKS